MQILIPQATEVIIIVDEKHNNVTISIEDLNGNIDSLEINNVDYCKVHYPPKL